MLKIAFTVHHSFSTVSDFMEAKKTCHGIVLTSIWLISTLKSLQQNFIVQRSQRDVLLDIAGSDKPDAKRVAKATAKKAAIVFRCTIDMLNSYCSALIMKFEGTVYNN